MSTMQNAIVSKKKGISGSSLKLIAIITMLIDHVGAALLGRYLWKYQYVETVLYGDLQMQTLWMEEYGALYWTYQIMRWIGRIAFPIYCFLLIEGFQKTRDVKKYALRLGTFALLSEIPFDLAFKAQVLEFTYQNIFFTLLLGLLTMIACDRIGKTGWKYPVKLIGMLGAIALGAGLAEFLHTDYGYKGVLCILVMFLFHHNKAYRILAGCVMFSWEYTAPLAFIPIGFYNGERGWKLKYVFYLFYPLHLLVIYLVAMLAGMNGYAAL